LAEELQKKFFNNLLPFVAPTRTVAPFGACSGGFFYGLLYSSTIDHPNERPRMSHRFLLLPVVLFATAGIAHAQSAPVGGQPGVKPPGKVEPKKADAKKESKPAAEATLKVGSKAPAIQVSNWVKGAEVKAFESGKVYIVEFWATWCPPCKKSIPQLNKLAKSHKDVTIIGVSVWESTHGKTLTDVQQFVQGKGEGMSYTVAFDGDKTMEKSWLAAAGVRGIPSAFVVGGDGTITWNGNPLAHEEMVAAVDAALKAAKSAAPATTPKHETKSPGEAPKPQPKPKG
jgi:thiol-disulfide isomerase/thioredoxin